MPRVFTVAEMRALEAAADRAGVSYALMMENAGRAVAEALLAHLDDLAAHKFLVVCGSGNNGGDGLVAAHYLSNAGARVTVYCVRSPDEADPKVQRLRAKSILLADAQNDQRSRVLHNLLLSATVVVDAIFGTGARFPLGGASADLLREVQAALDLRRPRPFVVAVDCPSGLDCDTGALDPLTIPADLTVTLAGAKRGHFAFPGADVLGELVIADIGIAADLPEAQAGVELVTPERVRGLLPARPRDAHKGTFGRALVAAGSVSYTGAAYLAGAAAYRAGAGLVTLAIPAPLHPILAGQLPEATWVVLPEHAGAIGADAAEVLAPALGQATAVLVGPGLGSEADTGEFLERLLSGGAARRRLGFGQSAPAPATEAGTLPPLVVDADGLRLLARLDGWPRRLPPNCVLTPHPGEMAALTGTHKEALQTDRLGAALRYAHDWGQVVVLKGAFTVIAAPDGRAALLPFATAALARAGTGDVLAGAIVGLLAQGLAPYEAALAAGYLHGRAGELAARALGQTASVLAGDVLEGLIEALAEMA
jgi:NAD(P)H-hydrate epimerase